GKISFSPLTGSGGIPPGRTQPAGRGRRVVPLIPAATLTALRRGCPAGSDAPPDDRGRGGRPAPDRGRSGESIMAEAATEERTNIVKITDAGPSRKKISIEIPAETVQERLRGSIDTLALEAALPGFRKGRAPRALVEKRFGSAVREEAKKELVASAYARAVEDSGLKVIGEPSSESLAEVRIEPGKPLAFEIEVEVMPE